MKRILYILISIISLFIVGYLYLMCVIKIDNDYWGLFEDKKNGEIGVLKPGYNFLWQAVVPGRVVFFKFNKKGTELFNLNVNIPKLEDIDNSNIIIKLSMNVIYEIEFLDLFLTYSWFENGNRVINSYIKKCLEGNLKKELRSYLNPSYKRKAIIRDENRIIKNLMSNLLTQCKKVGIKIIDHAIIGSLDLPAIDDYNSELRIKNELKVIEERNKKDLIIMEGELQKAKERKEEYYNDLSKISNLIRDNPDILKYIYIDKIADKVKVIITSDKAGLPFGLGFDEESGKESSRETYSGLK